MGDLVQQHVLPVPPLRNVAHGPATTPSMVYERPAPVYYQVPQYSADDVCQSNFEHVQSNDEGRLSGFASSSEPMTPTRDESLARTGV